MSQEIDNTIYEGKIDLSEPNNSHSIAFRFIHERFSGKRANILEVGCNTGYFGEVLEDYGHTVFGVELSESAAEQARNRISGVFVGTIEEFLNIDTYKDKQFDCITFGDVLEHLGEPLSVLQSVQELLAPNGIVVASVPNITHIAVRAMLFGGRWQYSARGILDSTHKYFFDKYSFVKLFAQAGYHVDALASIRTAAESTCVSYDPELLKKIENDISDFGAEVFQYVAVAQSGSENTRFTDKPLKVLVLWPCGEWSLGDIRLWNPLSTWSELYGGEVRSCTFTGVRDIDISWADIIVTQREASSEFVQTIYRWRLGGKAVIFDIDDLLIDVPEFLQTYKHYKRSRSYIVEALKLANMVTTTTFRLAEELEQHTSQLTVIPNCSSYWREGAKHYADEKNPVKILIASTDTVRVDFIESALQRILEEIKTHVSIVAIGPIAENLENAGICVTKVPILTYREFLEFVADQDNSIGLIPLDASRFSACKSPIKYIDYGRCNVPSICSNVPPYNDVIRHDENGILVDNNEDAWYAQIKRLVCDLELRSKIANAAQTLAKDEFSLRVAAEFWENALRGALHHSVMNSVPPETLRSRISRRLRYLKKIALKPSAYINALDVFVKEGPKAVWKRIDKNS